MRSANHALSSYCKGCDQYAPFDFATNGLKVDQSVGCTDLPYLRYKIGFELDDSNVTDETTWILKNWRRNKGLRKEYSEDGIEDALSMTPSEIVELTLLIDQLM